MAAGIAKFSGARHVVITDVNDYRLELAKKIYDNGGILYEFLKGKGTLVFADEKTAADKEAKLRQQEQTAVSFERLLELLK